RSICSWRFSRRKRTSSSRSARVSAPGGPCPTSIFACCTQRHTADSVRSSSRATVAMALPSSRTSRTVSALNSSVNLRRFRPTIQSSQGPFCPSSRLSIKPGQVHIYWHVTEKSVKIEVTGEDPPQGGNYHFEISFTRLELLRLLETALRA